MPLAAVIPIRSFRGGKDRLSEHLEPDQRHRLGAAMSERLVTCCEQVGMIPAIVSNDVEVVAWASSLGVALVPETGSGLDGAASDGVEWASNVGLSWVVIHSDLPLVSGDDLRLVAEISASGKAVIAPSSDGGTSVISNQRPISFSYGRGSFHLHLPKLDEPEVVYRKGLAHDLDTPVDLASVMSDRRGGWVKDIVPTLQGMGQTSPKF